MAFVSELFDTVRDLTNDATDAQVTFALKKLYLNNGISRLWPNVWSVKTLTQALTLDTYEYSAPVGLVDGHLISVELNSVEDPLVFRRFGGYDIIAGDEDIAGFIVLSSNPRTGTSLRLRYAAPVTQIAAASYAAAQSEVWTGPDRAMGIPVHYAMSMITARKADDRQDTLRYSTTQAANGVTDNDIMSLSQMWMGQFELELSAFDRPLPIAKD